MATPADSEPLFGVKFPIISRKTGEKRQLAVEARAVAARLVDLEAKQVMLTIADGYERLAAHAKRARRFLIEARIRACTAAGTEAFTRCVHHTCRTDR